MKKLLYTGLLLLFALSGCNKGEKAEVDQALFSQIAWINASDHNITLTVNELFENEQIAPGEMLIKEHGAMASRPKPSDYVEMGVVIVFDKGPYGGIFDSREDKKLNPACGVNYAPPTSVKEPYIYTFTNADYDAAVARGPMEKMPE